MKQLKDELSELAAQAAQGEVVHIYRYKKPYIKIVPDVSSSIHVGKMFGKAWPKSSSAKPRNNRRSLEILLEDRRS